LTIVPGSQSSGGIRSASDVTTLTNADAKAIAADSDLKSIDEVAAEFQRNAQVTAGRNNTNTRVAGVTAEYLTVRNLGVASGSFITSQHVTGASRVAVLGPVTVTDLFGEGVDPVGRSIRINTQAFTVVGVTTAKGGSGFNNMDDVIYIPLTTAQKIVFGENYVSSIYIKVADDAYMDQTRDDVGYFLLTRHRIKDPYGADFRIMSQEDIIGAVSEVTGTFTTLLAGIAAISLVVGGIGIMNIMLVTVTERTREIGLRKAMGAQKRWITAQFLTESVIITFVGGVFGIFAGTVVSLVISNFMNLPPTLSIMSVLLAFGVSTAIGIIFGWYPAQKASALNPIEALRYE
ncbi:hypothetical protein A2154_01435, partial [Candidatus Gottesmanbacteria bacterium RBG_16_43_7]